MPPLLSEADTGPMFHLAKAILETVQVSTGSLMRCSKTPATGHCLQSDWVSAWQHLTWELATTCSTDKFECIYHCATLLAVQQLGLSSTVAVTGKGHPLTHLVSLCPQSACASCTVLCRGVCAVALKLYIQQWLSVADVVASSL